MQVDTEQFFTFEEREEEGDEVQTVKTVIIFDKEGEFKKYFQELANLNRSVLEFKK